jgi:hypothetical protein
VGSLLWAIRALVESGQREKSARHFNEVEEAIALVPPRELMRSLVGPLPEPVLQYVARERELQKAGFLTLKHEGVWELPTPRAYESLVHFLRHAKHVQIVDHDIRRWFELLNQPQQKAITSTTFNYSQHILGVAEDRLKKGELQSYRRIFMLNEKLPCDLAKLDQWKKMDPAVQVLLTIWEFEERLRNAHRHKDVLGTRILVNNPGDTGTLAQQIRNYKDLVIVDGDVCVYEDLHCDRQTDNNSSFETHSWLYTREDYVGQRLEFFEELWPLAGGVDAFPAAKAALTRIPQEQRVRILGASH